MSSQARGTLPSRSPLLPPVDSQRPSLLLVDESAWPRSTTMSPVTPIRLGVPIDGRRDHSSARTYSTMNRSLQNMSSDPSSSYQVSDLTNYSMNDQRWTLQRKKIGLKRRTSVTIEKGVKDERSTDLNLDFNKLQYWRKECFRYVKDSKAEEKMMCYCGLNKEDHLPHSLLLHQSHQTIRLSHPLKMSNSQESHETQEPDAFRQYKKVAPVDLRMEVKDVEDEDSALNSILSSNSATSRTAGRNNNMRVRQHANLSPNRGYTVSRRIAIT